MSLIRVRSYLDENAPQFDGQDKKAFLKFMKAMFESPSYNAKVTSNITVNSTDKTITIPITGTAGFSAGNLVKLSGTLSAAFQSTFYRVISSSDNKLVLSISNSTTVAYPASDLSTSILVEHAPLDWEVCYSTATQFSLRSKDPTSSKYVLTLSESKNPKMSNNPAAYSNAVAAKVSKDIDKTTGAVIDDLTSVTNGRSNFSEGLHFVWNCSSYYSTAVIAGNVPWFLISSSKFVYLLIGAQGSSRNFSRTANTAITRDTFYFGDPDFMGDSSYLDYGGYLLNSCFTTNSDTSTNIGDVGGFTRKIGLSNIISSRTNINVGYWMRPFESAGNDVEAISLYSFNNTTNTNSGGGTISYPNGPTRGLLFFPIFVGNYISASNNAGSYVRSTLPFTLYSPNSLNNYANTNFVNVDYTLFKTYDNKLILTIVSQASSNDITSCAFFDLD